MSPETIEFIPKFIEAVEAGHIKLFAKKYPRCDDVSCIRCIFDCVCDDFTNVNNHGTFLQRWNTSYRQFIKSYINHKKSSIEDFKLKYPELFV